MLYILTLHYIMVERVAATSMHVHASIASTMQYLHGTCMAHETELLSIAHHHFCTQNLPHLSCDS